MATTCEDLNILFLPLLAPGHTIPLFDLAFLLSNHGVRSTIVTTPSNAELLRPSLSGENPNIHLITIPFPSDSSDSIPDNIAGLPTPDITPAYFDSLCRLEPDFDRLVHSLRPDCIISDLYYPWTSSLAKRHGIPRIIFHGSSIFCIAVAIALSIHRIFESEEFFLVPGLPHPIRMIRSQIPTMITSPAEFMATFPASMQESYGTIMNTFEELDGAYIEAIKSIGGGHYWNVGPLFLFRRSVESNRNRGGATETKVFSWLEGKQAGSVLYTCFGSLARFTATQLREIKTGLEDSGRPFVWVVRDDPAMEDGEESNGFVIKGWAPQLEILRHGAVGGFLTHCGWNSCLEGIAAGVPMITWPLFADQHFNERLLVDVLGVAVGVGSMVSSVEKEERTVVVAGSLAAAVEEVMGGGEEADDRRKKARELKKTAEKAVAEGGSSEIDLVEMVAELKALKMGKCE